MKVLHNVNEKLLFIANTWLSAVVNLPYTLKLQKLPPNPRILIVKWDEIGDMVNISHLFSALHSHFPQAHITLLCKPMVDPLVAHNPYIHKRIHSVQEWKQRYHLVIEFRGTSQTLLKALRYIPILRLDRGTVRFKNLFRKQPLITDRQTHHAILQPLLSIPEKAEPQIYTSPSALQEAARFIEENQLESFAIIHATANKPLKAWPPDRFVQLMELLYKQYQLKSVVIGSKLEYDTVQSLCSDPLLSVEGINAAGKLSLTALYELCKQSALFVGNDSGPMHIANAAQCPVIGLFGPGPAHVFYPEGPKTVVLHHVLECNPCDQVTCVKPNHSCMQRIDLQDVMSQVWTLLGRPKKPKPSDYEKTV